MRTATDVETCDVLQAAAVDAERTRSPEGELRANGGRRFGNDRNCRLLDDTWHGEDDVLHAVCTGIISIADS